MIKYKKNKLNAMNSYKKALVAIHVAVWLVILISPLTFFDRGDRFEADKLIPMLSTPIAPCRVHPNLLSFYLLCYELYKVLH